MKHCLLLTCLLFAVGAIAQTPQRTDIVTLLNQLPKLPATTQEALALGTGLSDPYLNYADQMHALMEKIQTPNPITIRVQKQAVATDAKFKADGVDKMADAEKIAYAKKHNLGGPGSNNRIDFAQKMQDPAFRKQFDAMTPQQKMALMQQQGVMAAPATVPQTSNPMQADMMAIMQDPAMREKWKAMSPAEKQAFIEQQKKANGYDAAKRPNQPKTDTGSGFGDMLDSPASATPAPSSAPVGLAIAKSRALQESLTESAKAVKAMADRQQQQYDQAMATMQNAITELGKKESAEGLAEAKRLGKPGDSWVLTNAAEEHRIRMNAIQQQQRADNAMLTAATIEWTKRQAALKKLVADYQSAMTTIQYGESLFSDDSQFQNAATLSGQQATVFGALQDVANAFNKIASQAAKTQDLLGDESKMTPTPRQLLPASGG